ncbi:MAG: DHHW family protein [Candidatus Flemingibacterium sp.]|nr:DHHW family protein [Candidatus Flemingibacterium sp.]
MLDVCLALYDFDDMYKPSIYYSDAEEGSDNRIDDGYLSYIFCDEYDVEIKAMSLIDEYALALPTGLSTYEIDVIKAKSAASAGEIKALFENRAAIKAKTRGELENYNAEMLPVLDGCEIYVKGKYVFLLTTDDNSAAKAAIDGLLSVDKAEIGSGGSADALDSSSPDGSENITEIASHVNSDLGGDAFHSGTLSDNPSELPELTFTSHSGENTVVMGGKCVQDAKIHVRTSDNSIDKTFSTDYTDWCVEIEIPSGITNLLLTQEEPGKGESEQIIVTVQPRPGFSLADQGVCQVAFGDKMQGHFFGQLEDWCGTNILSDNQVDGVQKRIKSKVDYLAGRDCKLVYLIITNPMEIYPETAPERFVRSDKDISRTEQFEKAARAAGATVIDAREILEEHRDDIYKIYNKTDSHWTAYGAYWGYKILMDEIGKDYEAAKPLPIDGNFEFYNKESMSGDMMVHLLLQNSLLHENGTFVKWLTKAVSNPDVYVKGSVQLDFSPVQDTQTVRNRLDPEGKPTAMIVRDSFSTNIYGYVNNSFSEVYWQNMWNYKFDKDYIENTNPDYYIYIVAERNIGNLLG